MQDPSQPALRHEVVLGAAGLSPPAQGFLHVRDSEGGLDTAPFPLILSPLRWLWEFLPVSPARKWGGQKAATQ